MRLNDKENSIIVSELAEIASEIEPYFKPTLPKRNYDRDEVLKQTENPSYWISSFSGVPEELYKHEDTFSDEVLDKAISLSKEVIEKRSELAKKLGADKGEVDMLAFEFQQGNICSDSDVNVALKEYIRSQAKLYRIASNPSKYKSN